MRISIPTETRHKYPAQATDNCPRSRYCRHSKKKASDIIQQPVDQRQAPTVSPLQASIAQLRGLPPALIIVDENDVLRDEGEAYARKLQQAEVPVTAVRALGTIHDFVLLNALAETPATRGAIAQATALLRRAFAGQTEPDVMHGVTAAA